MHISLYLVAFLGLACAQASKSGRVNIGGKEYFFSTDELSWTKAFDKCHGMGMKMLAIETATENTAIFDYFDDNGLANQYFWSGGKELNDTATTDGIWTWVDLDIPVEYNDWPEGRPNPFARGFCLYLSTWSHYWLDGDCGAAWKYVCEAN